MVERGPRPVSTGSGSAAKQEAKRPPLREQLHAADRRSRGSRREVPGPTKDDRKAYTKQQADLKEQERIRAEAGQMAKKAVVGGRTPENFIFGFDEVATGEPDLIFVLADQAGVPIDLPALVPELSGVVYKKDAEATACHLDKETGVLSIPASWVGEGVEETGKDPSIAERMLLPVLQEAIERKALVKERGEMEKAWKAFREGRKNLYTKTMEEQSEEYAKLERAYLEKRRAYEDALDARLTADVQKIMQEEKIDLFAGQGGEEGWKKQRRIAKRKSEEDEAHLPDGSVYVPRFVTREYKNAEGEVIADEGILSGVKTKNRSQFFEKLGDEIAARQEIVDEYFAHKYHGNSKRTKHAFAKGAQYVKPVLLNPVTGFAAVGAFAALRGAHWLMKLTRLDKVLATAHAWAMNNPITRFVTFGKSAEWSLKDVPFMPEAEGWGGGGGGKKKSAGHGDGHGGGGGHH